MTSACESKAFAQNYQFLVINEVPCTVLGRGLTPSGTENRRRYIPIHKVNTKFISCCLNKRSSEPQDIFIAIWQTARQMFCSSYVLQHLYFYFEYKEHCVSLYQSSKRPECKIISFTYDENDAKVEKIISTAISQPWASGKTLTAFLMTTLTAMKGSRFQVVPDSSFDSFPHFQLSLRFVEAK